MVSNTVCYSTDFIRHMKAEAPKRMELQHIMVVGAGAVGGYFGARLASHHPDVSFVLRPRTLEAVKAKGLTVRSGTEVISIHPRAASDPRDLPAPDLIILAVKAYDLEEVLDQIQPVVHKGTVLLTLQNGVHAEDRPVQRFGRNAVIGGVAFIYARIAEPGIIDHFKRGSLTIGELNGDKSVRVGQIAEMFTGAGVPCHVTGDIHRAKWEKMCWNCVFNPLTVILDDRVAKALDHPEMLRLIPLIVEEVAAVAAAHKITLPDDISTKVVQWTEQIRDIHTSMYDDWKAGRPTEIEMLNGHIVRMGRELGIPTPANETLTALVKTITSHGQNRGKGMDDELAIDGEVIQPLMLGRETLRKLPEEVQVPDVSTVVPGMKGRGVRVQGLLNVPALNIGADHVTFHAQDGQFAASLSLEEARVYGILIYEIDGAPLPPKKGGPFRLVTPGLGDLCANVKGVTRLEITRGAGKDTRPSVKKHD